MDIIQYLHVTIFKVFFPVALQNIPLIINLIVEQEPTISGMFLISWWNLRLMDCSNNRNLTSQYQNTLST